MKTKVKHIAGIQTGLFAKPIVNGEVVYLQAKHFDEEGIIKRSLTLDLQAKDISEKHLLIPGDVLFAAKGTKNFASVFGVQHPPSVASTSFFVLRLINDHVLPEFLAWFLNHPSTQQILKGQAIGSSLVSISKTVLEELDISVPSMVIQEKILHISRLRNIEKKLKQEIEALKEKQIQQKILNAIK